MVFIKEMELPDDCLECPLSSDECFGAYKCEMASHWGSESERAEDCPMKSKGDLITFIREKASESVKSEMLKLIEDFCK